MDDKIKLIDSHLKRYLAPAYPDKLYEAMEYSVFSKGKRMRPLLTLLFCESLGGSIDDAMPFAVAIELIHTYSLIHDDLPALDNDNFRRGRPTSHIVFGEAMAILAGDALLNKAYEIMALQCAETENKNAVLAMKVIAEAAGSCGMIGGQVVDILSENKNITLDTLIYIHKNKTAALIRAAILAGGYMSGADEKTINILSEIGISLGVAFQIKDDILDVEGDFNLVGKPIGSDAKNAKTTYVSLKGIDNAKADFENMCGEVFKLFCDLKISSPLLESYIKHLAYREF